MKTESIDAYEKHALEFLSARDRSTIGVNVVEQWARTLHSGAEILEIGCGGGLPVTRVLLDAGCKVWAVDSSPTLLATFKTRFPNVPVDCANVLESDYFHRQFHGIVAIGLVFLLGEEEQVALLQRAAARLVAKGQFLFTAPIEIHTWVDTVTGNECRSLGRERYECIFAEVGFHLVATYVDEGGNNYYAAERDAVSKSAEMNGRSPASDSKE